MRNEKLRLRMADQGMTTHDLATELGVDPKTVTRWIGGRLPHAGTRLAIARLLDVDEDYLWPQISGQAAATPGHTEILQVWGTRAGVPAEVWHTITSARRRLDILVYSGGFIIETFDLPGQLRRLSGAGGRARILLGDPTAEEVIERGQAEGLPSLAARTRSSHEYLREVCRLPGVELRTHGTPLYVSIYRGDEVMAINTHTHGLPAMNNPVLVLQPVPHQPLWPYYARAFDRVWAEGRPVED